MGSPNEGGYDEKRGNMQLDDRNGKMYSLKGR